MDVTTVEVCTGARVVSAILRKYDCVKVLVMVVFHKKGVSFFS